VYNGCNLTTDYISADGAIVNTTDQRTRGCVGSFISNCSNYLLIADFSDTAANTDCPVLGGPDAVSSRNTRLAQIAKATITTSPASFVLPIPAAPVENSTTTQPSPLSWYKAITISTTTAAGNAVNQPEALVNSAETPETPAAQTGLGPGDISAAVFGSLFFVIVIIFAVALRYKDRLLAAYIGEGARGQASTAISTS